MENWKPIRVEVEKGRKFPVARGTDMTASVMGALFGEHNYCTTWQLWQKFANGARMPEASLPARIGNALEHSVAQLIEIEECMVIEKETGYFREPTENIGAMLDYWCYKWGDREFKDGIPLDIKIINDHAWARSWGGGKQISPAAAVQITVQCALTQRDTGLLGCFIGGAKIEVVEIPFSEPLFEEARSRVREFFVAVRDRIEPMPDYEKDQDDLLKMYRRTEKGKTVDLSKSNAAHEIVSKYKPLAEEKKALDKRSRFIDGELKALKAELFHMMKDAEFASVGSTSIKTKTTNRAGYEVKPTEYRTMDID